MDSPAQAQSNIRRIQRFLGQYALSLEWVGLFILLLIPKHRYKLSMDRTNWDFGLVSFNLLVITVYWDKIGFPIYFEALDKKGNSHTRERKDALKQCLERLGPDSIDAFYADREFIGADWVKWLLKQKIPFYIRVRNNHWIELPRGQRRRINRFMQGKRKVMLDGVGIFGCYLSLAIKRIGKDELVSVITNTFAQQALVEYRNRWSIEVFFQTLKKRGFDLEATHLRHPERMCRLFALCSMAFAICFLNGKFEHARKPIAKKKHGYKQQSFFRKGLDTCREAMRLNRGIKPWLCWITDRIDQKIRFLQLNGKIVV